MTPIYGWGKKGKKIIIKNAIPKKRYTLICAINKNKVIGYKIIKGSANAVDFKEFIIEIIKKIRGKKYLLMDNARIHHSKIVKEYMYKTKNEIIFNAPYSPEMNPIEHLFSKIKGIIRNKKTNTETKRLIKNIEKALSKVTRKEIENYYKKSLNFCEK